VLEASRITSRRSTSWLAALRDGDIDGALTLLKRAARSTAGRR
jgi:hypothetical protein